MFFIVYKADYLARYEQAKASMSNLQGQMNDLYAYCKEREAIIEDLEMKISKQGNALKESYKVTILPLFA